MKFVSSATVAAAVSAVALGAAFSNTTADNSRNSLAVKVRTANDRFKDVAVAVADVGNPLVEHVRMANARFEDASVALSEGYTAISCTDGVGGMVTGVHYVNQTYFREEVPAIGRPQVLIYEPGDDGQLTLVAVEYVTFKGPAWLEGQPYRYVTAPNRYGLVPFHDLLVWSGEPDPRGDSAGKSPDAACEQMRGK